MCFDFIMKGLFFQVGSEKNTRGLGRTRNFTTVVYPESAPAGWMELLSEQHVEAFVSPLHDRDVDFNGEQKKPHWHVIIMFDSLKTVEQAKEVFDLIGGVGCEKVKSIRGNARYLCHLDNPEKAQYDAKDVRSFAGADYFEICSLSCDKYVAIGEMLEFCEDNNVFSFSEFLLYCRRNRYDWFRVLCDGGAFLLRNYLRSRFWTQEYKNPKKD